MDENRPNAPEDHAEPQEYEAPRVEDISTEHGPVATAGGGADKTPIEDDPQPSDVRLKRDVAPVRGTLDWLRKLG
jgi:hypothetical protein